MERRTRGAGDRLRAGVFLQSARRFLGQCAATAARDLAVQRTYRASLALGVVSGLLGLLSYHFIGRLVGPDAPGLLGQGYFPFVCSGILVQGVVAASLGGLGNGLAREAREGTLEPALAAGARPAALAIGAAATPLALALAQMAAVAIAGILLFDLDLARARPGTAALALVLTLLACAPVGLLGAAAWLWWRRPGAVTTLASFVFGFLGGVYFPLGLLPEPWPRLAAWVPLGAGLEAIRAALLANAGPAEVAPALARLTLLAAIGLPLSGAVLAAAVRHARRRGTLLLV